MKLVREHTNFERGLDPKEAMGIGLWKERPDIIISLTEFKENGGILIEGRELYSTLDHRYVGKWLKYDENQNIDLMRNNKYKSIPVFPNMGVKVKTKVLYQ